MPSLFMLHQVERKILVHSVNHQEDGWFTDLLPVILAAGVCLLHPNLSSRSEIVIFVCLGHIPLMPTKH